MRISDCSSDVCSSDLPAVLLAGELPLFLGGLLSDIGYAASYQIQWTNFASWLIAGALVFSGFALLWALVDLIRARRRTGRSAERRHGKECVSTCIFRWTTYH